MITFLLLTLGQRTDVPSKIPIESALLLARRLMNKPSSFNVVSISGHQSSSEKEEQRQDRTGRLDVLVPAIDRFYKMALNLYYDVELDGEVAIKFQRGITNFMNCMLLCMATFPGSYSKEEHWKLIYLISLSGLYLKEDLILDLREDYLLSMMLKHERKPVEFMIGSKLVSFPYSIYVALGIYNRYLGDTDEGYRWLAYGEDRIQSFISHYHVKLRRRFDRMFELAKMSIEDSDAYSISPFVLLSKQYNEKLFFKLMECRDGEGDS